VWTESQAGKPLDDLFGKHRIWPKRRPGYQAALRAHNGRSIRRLLQLAARTDRVVKGATRDSTPRTLVELVTLLAHPSGVAMST